MMKWSTCDFDNKYENIKGIDDEGDIRGNCVYYTPENEVKHMMVVTAVAVVTVVTVVTVVMVVMVTMIVTKHDVVWQEGSIGKGMPAPMLLRRFAPFWVAIPPCNS